MTKEEVLSLDTIAEIRELGIGSFSPRRMSDEEFRHIFEVCDALWLHSGDPAQPHALLTQDGHSNGFVDTLRVLRFTNLCELFAYQLALVLREKTRYNWLTGEDVPDWVVGSDHAGAAFSHSVAMLFNAQHDFAEKGPDKTQVWNRFIIRPDEVVLQVEELVTTIGTMQAVRNGIRNSQLHPYPIRFADVAATLVHRSPTFEIEGTPIIYRIHFDIEVWPPAECPLCAKGSKVLRPKAGQNWQLLTGKA
jgi:orotate phosphoribosyltransferase